MSDYHQIRVEEAKALAVKFNKSFIVICAWSEEHQMLHMTTYGQTPKDKAHAAAAGEICAKALGMDTTKNRFFEDFRLHADAGKQKAMLEAIEKNLPALKTMARQIIHPTENTFSKMVKDFEAAIR